MLSGCTNKEFKLGWYDKPIPKIVVEIEKQYPDIKKEKLKCKTIPTPYRMGKQSEVSRYMVELYVAGKDCKSNLSDVEVLLKEFRDTNTTTVKNK